MKHNLTLNLTASDLQNSVLESIARGIYYDLMDSAEALKYAEGVKSEEGMEHMTVEDIFWQVAYNNADIISINVTKVIDITL